MNALDKFNTSTFYNASVASVFLYIIISIIILRYIPHDKQTKILNILFEATFY